MRLQKQINQAHVKQARIDLLFILIAAIIAAILEYYLGVIDRLLTIIDQFRHLLLTELFTLLLVSTVGFAIYSWRRWREVVAAQNDNLRLRQSVSKAEGLNQRYRTYAEAVTHGQEEERMRLGRELHDDTIHRLILLSQQVELALLDHHNSPITETLKNMQRIISSTINHIRRFIQELRPTYLDELGLLAALKGLTLEKRERTGIDVQFTVQGQEIRLPTAVELTFYRIAQTALHNIERHAQATHAGVFLKFMSDSVELAIQDNGVGFVVPDFDQLMRQRHFGLVGMQERAALHGATLEIDSVLAHGTTVYLTLPVPT